MSKSNRDRARQRSYCRTYGGHCLETCRAKRPDDPPAWCDSCWLADWREREEARAQADDHYAEGARRRNDPPLDFDAVCAADPYRREPWRPTAADLDAMYEEWRAENPGPPRYPTDAELDDLAARALADHWHDERAKHYETMRAAGIDLSEAPGDGADEPYPPARPPEPDGD